jgi:hypothetical protein
MTPASWCICACSVRSIVLIYFVNDHERGGPTTEAVWAEALAPLDTQLGLGRHKLSPYILDSFVDVDQPG